MSYMNERREDRPCKRCGYVRRVTVRDRTEYVLDGGTKVVHGTTLPTGEHKVVGESYEDRCRACQLEVRILVYERRIREIAKQVKDERARQERAKQRATLARLRAKGSIP